MRRCFLILFLFLFPLSPARGIDLSSQVKSFRLSNGMRWLLVERSNIPLFSGIVVVRAGGVDEVLGKTGLAHMFEHMAFKGSPEIEGSELWETFVRQGASNLNAFTTKDITAYHASMPATQFRLWAYLFSEMIFNPAMREFYQERDVVMEERRLRYDNDPRGFFYEKLVENAFPKGPFHWAPIGHPEDLETLTVSDATQFHHQHYVPGNMVGVLVGDIGLSEAKKVLEEFFGRFPKQDVAREKENLSFAFRGQTQVEVRYRAEPSLLAAFYKPKVPAREDYIFDMLLGLLCEGRTGRLYQRLVKEAKVASSVSCSANFPGSRQDNLFVIFVTPLHGNSFKKIEAMIFEELHNIGNEVQERELEKVQQNVLYDFLWGLEDDMELAQQLAITEAIVNDWRYIANYPEQIRSITKEEVQKTSQKYFQKNNRVMMVRLKKQ